MREKVAPFYWAAAGALVGFGLMTIGGPFLLAGVIVAVAGLLLRRRGIWAFFVGFGGLPALVFLRHIFNGVRSALNPYCAQLGGPPGARAGAGAPGPASVSCWSVPASYYVMFAVFAVVTLSGVALGLLLRRTGRSAASS